MRASILSFIAIATCTNAFTPSSRAVNHVQRINGLSLPVKSVPTSLRMSDATVEAVEKQAPPNLPKPALMDEGIFTFNKILIDTVYNIICFFYPVTGGKRDFARFYVLETVARVPYFAYLSVMHLRYDFKQILFLRRFTSLFVSF